MENLMVSTSPHIHCGRQTSRIMTDVLIALAPAAVAGIFIFGWRALMVIALCVATSILSEFLFNLITKRKQTVGDMSAAVTGLLLALNLSTKATVWQCIVGSVFAIIVVKCLFGGLGCNFANPAISARIFLLIAFSGSLAGGGVPRISSNPDLVSGATPLDVLQNGGELPSVLDMLLGLRGGAIGETCVIALLLGFAYLVIRRVINFEVPLIFVATVFVLSLIFENSFAAAFYQIISGGLMLGAIFMATDYVTTPITRSGRMIFALGCGIITYFIRLFGTYPEGVSFAILLMNILSPYIEKLTKKQAFGGKTA